MNLIQQAEQLKHMPDSYIQQLSQNPGQTPGYLVLAEMQRRKSMRQAYTSAQSQNPMDRMTVAQEMQMSASPAPAEGRTSGMQPGQAPARFAKGGIARYAEGDWIDETSEPSMPIAPSVTRTYAGLQSLVPRTTPADIRQQFDQFRRPSPLEGLDGTLLAKEEMYRNRRAKLGDILMSLGLGMAASRRPDFGGAVAEGGLAALSGWQANRDRNQMLADRAASERMAVLRAQQASGDVETREMGELYRAAVAGDNTAIAALTAAERQASGQSFEAGQNQAKLSAAEKAAAARIAAEAEAKRLDREGTAATHAADRESRERIAREANASQEKRQGMRSARRAGRDQAEKLDGEIRSKYFAAIKDIAASPEMMSVPGDLREAAIERAALMRISRAYKKSDIERVLSAPVDVPAGAKGQEAKGALDRIKEFLSPPKTNRQPLPVVGPGSAPQGAARIVAPGAAPIRLGATPPFMPSAHTPQFGGISVLARGLGLPTDTGSNEPIPYK